MNLDDNQENQGPVQEIKTAEIAALIKEALEIMGVDSRVGVEQNVQGFTFNISSPDSNLLIGQRGANLHALQTLIHSIAYKRYGPTDRFTLDVDDYKKKREWYLRETAKKAVEQLKRTGRPVALEPMPPHDRRVIHAFLSADFDFETESIGEEPNRRIVIKTKEKGF
ncbi:MAG: Jag family protein [Candidatus Doudnabacteria bacterium]